MSHPPSHLNTGPVGALELLPPTLSTPSPPPLTPNPGRAAANNEWSKVTVVLYNRQIVFLDRLATTIRENTGSTVKRAEILRALVDALTESGLDLGQATSERELKTALLHRLNH